jgi:hypothetical protein
MELQTLATPNLEVLDGMKAVATLWEYISELEDRRGKDLTERQTDAMIRLAKALISSINFHMRESAEAERLCAELQANVEAEFSLTGRFRKTVANVLEEARLFPR